MVNRISWVRGCYRKVADQLPDLREPAYHPGHRDFFHSIGFGTMAIAGAAKLNSNSQVSNQLKNVVNITTAAWASRLVLDCATPAGLPIFTKR
jgi:membrane-bound metal-dependent hydrolase YbcI (DUF457 family)